MMVVVRTGLLIPIRMLVAVVLIALFRMPIAEQKDDYRTGGYNNS
jgi:hypothetical protein